MTLLEIKGVSRTHTGEGTATEALKETSLTIAKGSFIAIMGPSGSGKSTLLHILGLLDRPTSGQYIFDGQDTSNLSDDELSKVRNQKMGFVFQSYYLLPRTSVLDNVVLPLQYSDVPSPEYADRAIQALKAVNMEHRLKHTQGQLSGGERQRVAIARALVNNPQVIFADEPTGNLDSTTGKVVMETIDQLHQQGHTIILVTHETPTAKYAQRIIQLHDGEVVSDESTKTSHQHYRK